MLDIDSAKKSKMQKWSDIYWQTRKNRIWNEGYMAEIVFNGNEKMIHLHPYKQGTEEVTVTPMDRVSKESFDNEITRLNDIIAK